jgi:SPP1 family predicted phage head-tail adaptor
MPEVEAGKLRKRLTVTAPPNPNDADRDSFGQPKMPQGEEFQLWGSVEAVSGRESWQAAQAQVIFSHRVLVRYSIKARVIGKDWRITFEGKTLNVMCPARDVEGRRRQLEILCQESDRP